MIFVFREQSQLLTINDGLGQVKIVGSTDTSRTGIVNEMGPSKHRNNGQSSRRTHTWGKGD
jgi:hypothetical protein